MITITEQELKNILTYLGDLPAKYANPLISFFQTKELVKENIKEESKVEKEEEKA